MKLCLNRSCKPKANDKPLTHEQQILADNNRGIAYECARKKPILGMDPDENEAEALLCLVRAASRFDPSLGFAFTTFFCSYWRGHRLHGYRERQMLSKGYDKSQTAYHDDANKMFDPEDLQPGPDELAEYKDDIAKKREAFGVLDARSRLIIRLRAEGRSLAQVGRDLGTTRERIRQIEKRAIYEMQSFYGIDFATSCKALNDIRAMEAKRKEAQQRFQAKVQSIRDAREKFPNWSTQRIADHLGLSQKTVIKYGRFKSGSLHKIKKRLEADQ